MIKNSVPYILEKTASGERMFDLWSMLNKNRLIFLSDEINSYTASIVVAQLLCLDTENAEEPIQLIISSGGGHVSAGLSIMDVMNYIRPAVHTICVGNACSMAAVLLAAGAKGKRYCLPHSSVMIHQVSSGTEGTMADIRIAAKHIEKTNDVLAGILAEKTGNTKETILEDIDRDYWMSAQEALDYGIVDEILYTKKGITV